MTRYDRRSWADPRYHVRRSAPVGRIMVRPQPRIFKTAVRMKPKAWPTDFWFKSELFARGTVKRRAAFAHLLAHSHPEKQA